MRAGYRVHMPNAHSPTGTGMEIRELVEADHRHVRALFAELRAAAPDERAATWSSLLPVLAVHEVAEEQVLFPAVRAVEPGLAAVLDARIEEQKGAEELLVTMEQLDPSCQEFERQLAHLESSVLEHAAAEERELFPVIARRDDVLDQRTLGARYDAAKRRAPTRPHPAAPHRPPANLVAGPFVSFVDRVRDHLA